MENNTAQETNPSRETTQVKERTVKLRSGNYDIKKLWANQKEILRLLASGLYTPDEVSEICGVSPSTVYRLARTEHGQRFMEMIEGSADAEAMDMISRIQSLAPIALSIQTDILLDDSADLKLRNQIADKIQDRAGYVPVTKNINMNMSAKLKKEDIEQIKEKAAELRALKDERNLKDED